MVSIAQIPTMVESISEAKAHFSAIIDGASDGKTFVICRAGKPVATLAPYVAGNGCGRIGLLKGKFKLSKDWWKNDREADAEIVRMFDRYVR